MNLPFLRTGVVLDAVGWEIPAEGTQTSWLPDVEGWETVDCGT